MSVVCSACSVFFLLLLTNLPFQRVLPGGHVDVGESVPTTAVREVLEETGLQVCNLPCRCARIFARPTMLSTQPQLDPATIKPLCLWESVYPTLLARGQPKSHLLVIFLRARLAGMPKTVLPVPTGRRKKQQAQAEDDFQTMEVTMRAGPEMAVKLQESEVDRAAWMFVPYLRRIVQASAAALTPSRSSDFASIQDGKMTAASSDNALAALVGSDSTAADPLGITRKICATNGDAFEMSEMCGVYPNASGGGIAEGHFFALQTFLSLPNSL